MRFLDSPPPFDPDAPWDQVLASPKIKYHQCGHYYSPQGHYMGSEDSIPGPEPSDSKRAAQERMALARKAKADKALKAADAKRNKPREKALRVLKGTTLPSETARAERENLRAKQAEEQAE